MTEKTYLITEAQIHQVQEIFSLGEGASRSDIQSADSTLQSLPMVTDTPCGYGQFDPDGKLCDAHDFQDSHVYTTPLYTSPQALTPEDDGSDWFYKLSFICRVLEGVDPINQDKATALGMAQSLKRTRWTAEKALTPITAEDVSDKTVIDLWRIGVLTSTGTQGKEIAAKVYNAVIKHKAR